MEIRWNLPGKAYVVGAGPDSAKLLTARAAEVLRRADVVLHDEAVPRELLEMVPSRTAVYNIQKGTPEDTIRRMISAARTGQTVVRLKSGDPRIDGETQDEIHALRDAGIEFEILPGNAAEAQEVIELFRAEEPDVEARNDIHV